MKAIKFRAWDKRINQMKPVAEISFGDGGSALTILACLAPKIDAYWRSENVIVHGESGILMQFTGLLDASGKEIYEGDIVRDNRHKSLFEIRWCGGQNEFLRSQAGWILDDEKFCSVGHIEELTAHRESNDPSEREDYYNGVVVGNIYEHPALAEENKQL